MLSISIVVFCLFTTELMNQGVARRAILEHRDDNDVGYTRELMALS
jgi:hypothetical protein